MEPLLSFKVLVLLKLNLDFLFSFTFLSSETPLTVSRSCSNCFTYLLSLVNAILSANLSNLSRWIKVKQTAEVYNKLTFDNGTTLGLVGEGGTQGYHRIFNKQACCFTHTGVPETPNGTITFAEDKSEPVLVSQELIYDTVDYYNIITDKHFNLFANGILTSCRCSNLYKIENMKYVGDRTMSDKEIEEYFKKLKNLQLTR